MMNADSRSSHPELNLAEIRALAQRFSPDELEACIREQLNEGANVCEPSGRTEEIVSILAKAEFVKALMGKGATLPAAMRELGQCIRAVQKGGVAG